MKILFKIILFSVSLLSSQTTEQIKRAKEIIDRSGMSEAQVRNVAKSQGYSDQQIDAAIQKGKSLENKPSQKQSESLKNEQISNPEKSNDVIHAEVTSEKSELFPEENILDVTNGLQLEIDAKTGLQPEKLNYFGYDIFARDPALFQATSVGTVDPDYLVGPGDDIIVMLWGETQFRQVLKVDREGFVFIPEIGQVFVNGLNLSLLESKLFRVFSQSYASLNPQDRAPTTFLDVSLGNLRPLRIQVLGEVGQPGAYTVSPSATLFSSLYYFNGPTYLGTLRNIELIRGGEKITSIDFYDYLLTGKKPKDQKLQLDDVVFIPKREKTIKIIGEVNRPGIYELKPEEYIDDLFSMAGGLKITAYLDRCQINRVIAFENRIEPNNERKVIDVNIKELFQNNDQLNLNDGDLVIVFPISEQPRNAVTISGAVFRDGMYQLTPNMSITDLIDKSGGLIGDAYKERIDITRVGQLLNEDLIKVNLDSAFKDFEKHNLQLEDGDHVRVYSYSEMVTKNFVTVNGYVKKPGRFLLKNNMKISDAIFLAGGTIDDEFNKKVFYSRADLFRFDQNRINRKTISFDLETILRDSEHQQNLLLQPGDNIKIYSKDIFEKIEEVTVSGPVQSPGVYSLRDSMTINDLMLEVGGLIKPAEFFTVEIARLNSEKNKNDHHQVDIIRLLMSKDFKIQNTSTNPQYYRSEIERNNNLFLRPNDYIVIRTEQFKNKQQIVTVTGAVRLPGEYALQNSGETIVDVINRAGGLLSDSYPFASSFTRMGKIIKIDLEEILRKPIKKNNILLQNGDVIFVAYKPTVIEIVGEVNSPGFYKFRDGSRISDYINESGGFTQDANIKDVFITYTNGKSKYWSPILRNAKVRDGSRITVGKKKEEEPFDRTEYAKDLTSIIANLAQAISLIILAKN